MPPAFTLFIEDCRLDMELKEVNRTMKATDMVRTFFMISHFSELGESGLSAGGEEPMLALMNGGADRWYFYST